MNVLRSMDRAVTHWLTAPESHAAGRMGLYRIVFGLFALWAASPISAQVQRYADLPAREWEPIASFQWLNAGPPTP